jgi:hypothetical protein
MFRDTYFGFLLLSVGGENSVNKCKYYISSTISHLSEIPSQLQTANGQKPVALLWLFAIVCWRENIQ